MIPSNYFGEIPGPDDPAAEPAAPDGPSTPPRPGRILVEVDEFDLEIERRIGSHAQFLVALGAVGCRQKASRR